VRERRNTTGPADVLETWRKWTRTWGVIRVDRDGQWVIGFRVPQRAAKGKRSGKVIRGGWDGERWYSMKEYCWRAGRGARRPPVGGVLYRYRGFRSNSWEPTETTDCLEERVPFSAFTKGCRRSGGNRFRGEPSTKSRVSLTGAGATDYGRGKGMRVRNVAENRNAEREGTRGPKEKKARRGERSSFWSR